MRTVPFVISAIITLLLVIALNKPWGEALPMPVGKFLSPQTGFWQNAEPVNMDYGKDLQLEGLKGKVDVYFDERLVPHVFAENDEDLYFVQGYLHARFRLFQMDLQTKAAEGRASEIAGEKAIDYDKEQRRLGMAYAAKNALTEMEKDPVSKAVFTAYTAGVNAYIGSLSESELPLEYKLLNFRPEKWSNFRTALLLKMMAKMLASGTEDDLGYTNARTILTPSQFDALYPQVPDSLAPIIPKGTLFNVPAVRPVKPSTADSLYFNNSTAVSGAERFRPDKGNGSNNWVVSGSRTKSGAPILANDPHLELSLPSIWFEIQLSTPTSNAYGVSLPGSPFVIIGFNDNIAWGVTNASRDVKDYYEIRFRDGSKKEYWYNGEWKPSTVKIEEILVKGNSKVYDTVAYTIFGPVQFDERFVNPAIGHRNLAVRWAAHDPSNDGWTFYKLNRASNYDEYVDAISTFDCPGQNFVFASKSGDIAIWQQGKFPLRWEGQGLYIMPGQDSTYQWQGFIPQKENPHSLNPARGFLESANQRPVDSTYPYFIPGGYITPRGMAIEKFLAGMTDVTPQDMMLLQNNYYNIQAEEGRPILLKYVNESALTSDAARFLQIVKDWDFEAGPASKGQTIYQHWWDSLEVAIWRDDLEMNKEVPWPDEQTCIELLKRDSTSLSFIDDRRTTDKKETLQDVVTSSLNTVAGFLAIEEKAGRLEWAKFKDPTIYHLLKKSLMPFAHRGLNMGGNGNIINALTHSHGPSWRMIAQMGASTEAFGVYPGGQNGNPGSRFYDNFIDTWATGKYFPLWIMKRSENTSDKVLWKMAFQPAD